MNTQLANILAFSLIVTFMVLMFVTTNDKNRLYLKYVMLVFPLLRLDCVPGIYKLAVFDCLTILFFLFFYRKKQQPKSARNVFYSLGFLLILAASIIGCVNAESLSEGTGQDFVRLFSIFMFAKILIDECYEDASFIHSIISWLRVCLVVSLIFLIAQFVFGMGFTLEKELNKNILAEGARYTSYLSDPQKYAQFLAATSFLLLLRKDDKMPLINYGLFFLSIVALLFTGARAGLGGWLAGLLAVIFLAKSKYKFVVISCALILLFVVNTFKESLPVFGREQSVRESYEFRSGIWHDAYGIFLDNPYTGIGLGNYRNYVSVHNPDQFWITEGGISYYDQPESGYLKILTELGLLGFIPALLLILLPMVKALFAYFQNGEPHLVFLIASLVSWLVGFYTVSSFGDVRIMVLIVTIICLLITGSKKAPNYDVE